MTTMSSSSSSTTTTATKTATSPRMSLLHNYLVNVWDRSSPSMQFACLAGAVFLFFGSHNLLQEAMMQILDHSHGVMLGYLEVLGVTICTYGEAQCTLSLSSRMERTRKAPLSAYPWLTLCLLSSSALSNWSLNYINFPTKVVFRSSKLIPTMLLASWYHQQVYSSTEYTCATAICIGLILFAAADWRTTPSFHPVGLVLVTLSVMADAVLPNAQQAVFARYHASRLEVTLYTNVLTLLAYTVTTIVTGEAKAMLDLLFTNPSSSSSTSLGEQSNNNNNSNLLPYYIALYTIISYLAITAHMTIVKRYGGVAAIGVATVRKGLTLVLSFVLFPKAFSWYYPAGATLVLGGLTWASLYKQQQQAKGLPCANVNYNNNKMHSKSSDVELQQLQQQQQQSLLSMDGSSSSSSSRRRHHDDYNDNNNNNNNNDDDDDDGETLDKKDASNHGINLRHLHG